MDRLRSGGCVASGESAAESERMGASEHGASPALTRSSGAGAGAAESLAPVADLALADIISALSEDDGPEAIDII